MEYIGLNTKDNRLRCIKHTAVIVSLVSFCSLFYLNFFVEGFIITVSVVTLPILLYWFKELNSMRTTFFVAIGSPLFRMMSIYVSGVSLERAFTIIYPEIFFYMFYGIVFFMVYGNLAGNGNESKYFSKYILAVFLSDSMSNLVELSIRTSPYDINMKMFQAIVMIAFIRTFIVVIFIIISRYYTSFLVKNEHEENYQRLLLLTSMFWSEIYFMEKNMAYIENIMKKSYTMHKKAVEYDCDTELVNLSLEVAMEVHEVKKDYIRVIKGLESVTDKKFNSLDMSIKDIVSLIDVNTKRYLSKKESSTKIITNVMSDCGVFYHFYMTSILRNLINNSIESIEEKGQNDGIIKLDVYEDLENVVIVVSDNGSGIKDRDIQYIFNTGFSSKYDKDSGDSQRGLGLSIVKDLLKSHFDSDIQVRSKYGVGCSFTITISRAKLMGVSDEVLFA